MAKEWHSVLLIIVLVIALIVSLIFNFVQFSNENGNSARVDTNLQLFNQSLNRLNSDNLEIQNELNASLSKISQKDSDFEAYKDKIKKYVTINKVILDDSQAISMTINDYYNEPSNNYDLHKKIVDRYESELNVMRGHLEEYKTIIREDKDLFQEIGVDYKVEENKININLEYFDNLLKDMRDYLVELSKL